MALAAVLLPPGCAYYTGVAVKGDRVYLLGGTSYLGLFSDPWVKRCQEDGERLVCQQISIGDETEPRQATKAPLEGGRSTNAGSTPAAEPSRSPLAPKENPPVLGRCDAIQLAAMKSAGVSASAIASACVSP